jgi:carbonic anhydrase
VTELRSAQPLLRKRIADQRLTVAGAYYDLHTGLIELVDNVPAGP